jgi:hypothetical protein
MTDRLSLSNAFADAKIDRLAAERIATEIFDAIHHNVATKTDLDRLEHRLMMRLGSLVVIVAGILFVGLRYLPPVH